jgi:SNF2 family DNA or RNA helicase
MTPAFSKGDRVLVKALGNKVGIVDGEPRLLRGVWMYPVSLDPEEQSPYYPEDALESYIPSKNVEQLLAERRFAPARTFARSLIYKKLEKPLADNLYTFYASRTEFLVHQFKPVLKFLGSDYQRLLLADEVGLGKTIEAGIIITELEARLGSLSRVLVVCPSMLVPKWENELLRRFGQRFHILKANEFEAFLDRYLQYGEAERLRGICSLQILRRKKIVDRLRDVEPHFDVIVVDEAHHMRNPETLSSDLGEILCGISDAALFLSATPLQLGTQDLFNLLHLLVPEEFPDFSLFQDRISPNEHINDALRRLHDPAAALQTLEKVRTTPQRERFERDPRYGEAVQLLRSAARLSREQAIYLQRQLAEMNSLSYVFTRTKKREVETEFPVREAHVIPVQFTEAEMEFY